MRLYSRGLGPRLAPWRLLSLALLLHGDHAGAQATDLDTVLGAVSDSPPLTFEISGHTVQVFDAARNQLLERQGPTNLSRLVYYYEVPLVVSTDSDGTPLVRGPYPVDSKELVEISLRPASITREAILQGIKDSRNPYARLENILPLTVFRFSLTIPGAQSDPLIAENGVPLADDLPVQFVTSRGTGNALADRIRQGTSMTISYRTLVKLSQVQQVSATWQQVRTTKSYQRYRGPSGPRYITAAQVVHLSTDIASDLNINAWMEGDGGGFELLLNGLINGIVARRDRQELALEQWTDTRQFSIDTADLRAQRDKITHIASDARNLTDQQWCRKYQNSLNTLAENSSSWSDSWSGGLSVVIPAEIPLPIEGGAGANSSETSSAKSTYQQAAASEDCGRNQAAASFTYSWDGEKYEPKSIFVFNTIDGEGQIQDSASVATMRVRQRYGTVERRIFSRKR